MQCIYTISLPSGTTLLLLYFFKLLGDVNVIVEPSSVRLLKLKLLETVLTVLLLPLIDLSKLPLLSRDTVVSKSIDEVKLSADFLLFITTLFDVL